jgi:hypothetical protein
MSFKETEETITLHGLGFLQVKLGGQQRLHVWHPALSRRACFQQSAVHDHRFSFTSRVLIGTQRNIVWEAEDVADHAEATHVGYLHEGARTRFGNRPWVPNRWLRIEVEDIVEVPAGLEYSFDAYRFHSTEPAGDGRVATLMTKTWEGQRGAHSLCKVGVQPDVDFDRKQWPEDRLWEIVRDVLGGAA